MSGNPANLPHVEVLINHDTPEGALTGDKMRAVPRVALAEKVFESAVKAFQESERELESAERARREAQRSHETAKDWHRFARDQYLDRAYYKTQQTHLAPTTFEQWAVERRLGEVQSRFAALVAQVTE